MNKLFPNWSCLCGFIFVLVHVIHGDVYTSMLDIKDKIVRIRMDKTRAVLKELVNDQQQRLDTIKRFVQKLSELSGDEIRDPNFTVHHPLNAYRFIRNHSVIYNITSTKLVLEIRLFEQERDKIDRIASGMETVDLAVVEGTITGLLRLQSTYELATKDMANGNIGGVTSDKLTAADCRDMMTGAYQLKMIVLAKEWLQEALERIRLGDITTTTTKVLIKGATTAFRVDVGEAIRLYSEVVRLNPKSRYHRYKMTLYTRQASRGHKLEESHLKRFEKDSMKTKHDRMCRGILPKRRHTPNRKLLCSYQDNGHPLLRYQPAKHELLSLDPYISVYHGVIGHNHISNMMDNAKSQMEKRSEVKSNTGTLQGHYTDPILHDPTRSSKRTLLKTSVENDEMMKYIEALTSLKWTSYVLRPTSYEQFQVANYGVGGQYYTHRENFSELQPDCMSVKVRSDVTLSSR